MVKLGQHRRGFKYLLLGAILVLFAACVSNPGEFIIEGQAGSELTLVGDGVTTVGSLGVAACDDDVDNDLDGFTDSGSDSECDSTADANERIDGVQPFVAGTWPVNVAASGEVTADPTDLDFLGRELCINVGSEVWCLTNTAVGVGSPQVGSISSSSVTIPMSIVIELDAAVGFPGLDSGCHIGPIEFTLTGNSYDTTTGETTISATGAEVPETTSCGSYNGAFNSGLGLPGTSNMTINATILNGTGNPIQFDS